MLPLAHSVSAIFATGDFREVAAAAAAEVDEEEEFLVDEAGALIRGKDPTDAERRAIIRAVINAVNEKMR
jgi:hypothetical protein